MPVHHDYSSNNLPKVGTMAFRDDLLKIRGYWILHNCSGKIQSGSEDWMQDFYGEVVFIGKEQNDEYDEAIREYPDACVIFEPESEMAYVIIFNDEFV